MHGVSACAVVVHTRVCVEVASGQHGWRPHDADGDVPGVLHLRDPR